MQQQNIHVDEYGFRFTFATGFDFSGYNSLSVKLRKPDGTIISKTGSTDDASEGDVYYVVEDGVIDTEGTWQAQATITFGSKELKTDVVTFPVKANIE